MLRLLDLLSCVSSHPTLERIGPEGFGSCHEGCMPPEHQPLDNIWYLPNSVRHQRTLWQHGANARHRTACLLIAVRRKTNLVLTSTRTVVNTRTKRPRMAESARACTFLALMTVMTGSKVNEHVSFSFVNHRHLSQVLPVSM